MWNVVLLWNQHYVVAIEDAQNSIHFVINGGDGSEGVVVLGHIKGLCIVTRVSRGW